MAVFSKNIIFYMCDSEEFNIVKLKEDNVKIIDIYDFVIKEPERYVESNISNKIKLNTLNLLLKYFEHNEKYEKCQILFNLMQKIKEK